MAVVAFVLTVKFGLKTHVAGSYDTDAAFYSDRGQSFNVPSFATSNPNNVSKSSSVAKIKVVVCLYIIS